MTGNPLPARIVEAVARAIFVSENSDPDWDDGYETDEQAAQIEEDTDFSQETCRRIARAAILATIEQLKQPSVDALRVGVDLALHVSLGADYGWFDYMRDLNAAMLDAAKREVENIDGTKDAP